MHYVSLAFFCALGTFCGKRDFWLHWWRKRVILTQSMSPDGGPRAMFGCLQNVPWRMWNVFFLSFFLSLLFFFLFDLTISLSLPPDCIRIDCSLSKWFYPFFWLKCIHLLCSVALSALLCPHDTSLITNICLNLQVNIFFLPIFLSITDIIHFISFICIS